MGKTKKSLLFSGLALMMSALLLASTTFAWFTDSVTNKGNTIQSGNMDVTFLYRDVKLANQNGTPNDGYQNVEENTPLFKDVVWEPNRSNGYDFKVRNSSKLAFNYQLEISNIQVTAGNADITKMLDVYATNNVNATSIDEYTKVGTLEELKTKKVVYTSDKVMQPSGFEDVFSVVVCMNKDAGNEYQNCGVSFDLNLVAKQAMHETDGFGNNDYDANAEWPVVPDTTVTADGANAQENGAKLQAALNNAKDGAVIAVGAGEYDVTYKGATQGDNHYLWIQNDNVTLIGAEDGSTVITANFTGTMNGNEQQTVLITGKNVTLKNLTINPIQGYNNKTVELRDNADNVTIENCTINGNLYIGGHNVGSYTIRNNTFVEDNISIAVANGAGNAMTDGEKAVISGNTCSGALYLTGTRNTGWDNYDLEKLPEVTGNTFGSSTQTVNGVEYTHYIRVASTDSGKLALDVEDIKTNNSFDGKTGADWVATDVNDNGTYYRFYN